MPTGKPLKYIINSDYATLKNDSPTTTITLNIPAGDSIASGAYRTYTADLTVGTAGAPMEWQIGYSASTQRWLTPFLYINEKTASASPFGGYAFVSRSSANQARLTVTYFNGNPGSVTTNARTVTAYIRTFVPPFA